MSSAWFVGYTPRLAAGAWVGDDRNRPLKLTGAKELKPRWKRCVELADRALGEDLGRAYVEKAYPPETKKKMDALIVAVNVVKAWIFTFPCCALIAFCAASLVLSIGK